MLSIIIRTYNEGKFIGKLLSLIFKQNINDKFEVIIVDSGSTDNTLKIASNYKTEIIKIPKKDFSFGYSLNKGIENSNGEICVFISAHCLPYNDLWLSELVKPFKNKNVAMVYGRQIGDENITKFSEHQIFKKWFPENSILKQQHPFANNANSAIRKSVWEKIKFDEKLTGLEDIKWAKTILENGFNLCYNADAVIYHIHEESYRQIFYRYKREAIALKNIFPELKFSFFDFIYFFIKNSLNDLVISVKNRNLKVIGEILKFRFMQFYGTYSGNRAKYNKITEDIRNIFYYPPEKGQKTVKFYIDSLMEEHN